MWVLSPTASHLAILNHSGDPRATTVNIWDVNAREQVMEWKRLKAASDVQHLVQRTQCSQHTLKERFPYGTGKLENFIGTIARINPPPTRAIVFSADGRHLMVVSAVPGVELWNVGTLRLAESFEMRADTWADWVKEVVISPNERVMATFESKSTSIHVWDIKTQRLLWRKTSGNGRGLKHGIQSRQPTSVCCDADFSSEQD